MADSRDNLNIHSDGIDHDSNTLKNDLLLKKTKSGRSIHHEEFENEILDGDLPKAPMSPVNYGSKLNSCKIIRE